jgi:hypothetical protein
MGHGLDLPELEMLSLATLVTVQWRVEATDEVDSGDDCGTFMGEVEVGTHGLGQESQKILSRKEYPHELW